MIERVVSIDLGLANVGVCIFYPASGRFHFEHLRCGSSYDTLQLYVWARELYSVLHLELPNTFTVLERPWVGRTPGTYGISLKLHALYTGLAALLGENRFVGSDRAVVTRWCKSIAPDIDWSLYKLRKGSAVTIASRMLRLCDGNTQKAWEDFQLAAPKADDAADAFLNLIYYLGPDEVFGPGRIEPNIADSLDFELLTLDPPSRLKVDTPRPRVRPAVRRQRRATLKSVRRILPSGTSSFRKRQQPVRACRSRAKPTPPDGLSDGEESPSEWEEDF